MIYAPNSRAMARVLSVLLPSQTTISAKSESDKRQRRSPAPEFRVSIPTEHGIFSDIVLRREEGKNAGDESLQTMMLPHKCPSLLLYNQFAPLKSTRDFLGQVGTVALSKLCHSWDLFGKGLA